MKNLNKKAPPLFYKKFLLDENKDWVVLLHGAGGSSAIWFKQIRDFRKNFNVLIVDLRGHGKSKNLIKEWQKDGYTFDEVSKDVIDVLDYLNIKDAHFVGISLGTLIIRKIVENHPERVKSMILGGAIVKFNLQSKILSFLGNKLKRVIPYMLLYKIVAFIIMPKKKHKKSRFIFINEAKKLYKKEFLKWMNLLSEVKPLMKFFREKETGKPTLYIMGEEDYMFLPPVKSIVKKHKNAFLRILKDSGHVCNIDRPELFNSASIEFIKNYKKFINREKELLLN